MIAFDALDILKQNKTFSVRQLGYYYIGEMCFFLKGQILLDPIVVLRHLGVDARYVVLTTADSPADQAGQVPTTLALAHQRTATITL